MSAGDQVWSVELAVTDDRGRPKNIGIISGFATAWEADTATGRWIGKSVGDLTVSGVLDVAYPDAVQHAGRDAVITRTTRYRENGGVTDPATLKKVSAA